MPLTGLSFVRSAELLQPAEIERVVRAAVAVGFRKVRLTGGEPTLRPDIVDIVESVAGVDGLADVAMTTNGILMPRLAERLARAGLRRVNVHIDTLHPGRLQRVMRFATAEEVWAVSRRQRPPGCDRSAERGRHAGLQRRGRRRPGAAHAGSGLARAVHRS